MFQKLVTFVKYNNIFAIVVALVFGGVSASFAASPTLRDSVYSSTQTVSSVDNHLIVNSDLDAFNFDLKINSVSDDSTNYYVQYSYNTLEVVDSVWVNASLAKTITVNKQGLEGKDLGLYIAKQLGDNMKAELEYLKRVQNIEKNKGATNKVITVEYAGLVGKMINPTQEVIEGYTPVIPEVVPATETTPAVVSETTPSTENTSNVHELPAVYSAPVDPDTIKRIVDQYLAEHPPQTNQSNNVPTPAPSPAPTLPPEPAAPVVEPAVEPAPEPVVTTPDPTPSTEAPVVEEAPAQ